MDVITQAQSLPLLMQDQTIWPGGEPKTTGYLVGQREWGLRIGHNVRPYATALVPEWYDAVLTGFSKAFNGYTTIGSWTDQETGDLYLDVSYWYEDRAVALEVAQYRGEKAIWDLANAEEIRV